MAVESKKPNRDGKTYLFSRCPSCRVKVNIWASNCWKCGQKNGGKEKVWETHGSDNPNDAIYGWMLNLIDICIACPVTQRGRTCKYARCFGTGKGNCDMCREFEGTLFDCCQENQRQDKKWQAQHNEMIKQNKNPLVENIIAEHKKAVGL